MAEPSPLVDIETRIAWFVTEASAGKEWLYAVCSRTDEAILGGIGLHRRDGPETLEMGYWLGVSATGHGFVSEAADALTRIAFDRQPLSVC